MNKANLTSDTERGDMEVAAPVDKTHQLRSIVRALMILVVFLRFVLITTTLAAQDCTPPIEVELVEKDTAFRNDLDSWLCTTDFGTHEEARNFGIGLGVLVYGIPLQATGKFDSKTKEEWKKTHCQRTTTKTEAASRYRRLIKRVPQIAYTTWLECKRISAYGVQCWFEAPQDNWQAITFRAKWNPIEGDKGKIPTVRDGDIVGASRNDGKPFLTGHRRKLDANFLILLNRNPEGASVTAIINTDRGGCPATAPGHPPIQRVVYEERSKPVSFDKRSYQGTEAGGRGVMIRYAEDIPGDIVRIEGPTNYSGDGCGHTDTHTAWAEPASKFRFEGSTNSSASCTLTYNVVYRVAARTECEKYCD